ncbi:MAG TPA: AMP-binding protein, partial [Novosphingobium sp.]|nr:AMP-binding protein [Novosphingobium sp.]
MTDALYRPITNADMIAQALSRDLDRTVMILNENEVLTARELRDQISRYQQVLEGLSPRPGRVAVLARNRFEVPAIMTAISFADIVATTLHPMGSIEDYLYVLDDAGIDTLIYDEAHFEQTAQTLRERRPALRHLLSIGPDATGQAITELARGYRAGPLAAPAVDPDAMARIAYSGGTTGKPKGIVCTHRGIGTTATLQLTAWEWPDEIRHLICSPLSHAGSAVITSILQLGGSMIVLPGFEPVSFMAAVEKYRITTTLLVPTMVLSL